MLTPEKRAHLSSIGRLGGIVASATVDTTARAKSAQSAFRERFNDGHGCARCPTITIPATLPEPERARRADALFRAHFSRLGRA